LEPIWLDGVTIVDNIVGDLVRETGGSGGKLVGACAGFELPIYLLNYLFIRNLTPLP
jgi:hypothetical protein